MDQGQRPDTSGDYGATFYGLKTSLNNLVLISKIVTDYQKGSCLMRRDGDRHNRSHMSHDVKTIQV
jgi:hypothetical protein